MAQIELNSRTVAVTESKIGTALGEIDEGSLFYNMDGPTLREAITGNVLGWGEDVLDRSQVLHVKNIGGDGFGWSVIRLAKESIGLGLAAEKYGAGFFGSPWSNGVSK